MNFFRYHVYLDVLKCLFVIKEINSQMKLIYVHLSHYTRYSEYVLYYTVVPTENCLPSRVLIVMEFLVAMIFRNSW